MRTFSLTVLLVLISMIAKAQIDSEVNRGIELFNKKNYTAALPYLQSTSKAGSLISLCLLGYMYTNGLGVERDMEIGLNLYNKAVSNNYPPAMVSMGELHLAGNGVKADSIKAYNYFKKAADLEYKEAEFLVSCCKRYGIGTEVNQQEAFDYAKKAAIHGAQYEWLADMYYEGYGTEIDYSQAYQWYNQPDYKYPDEAQLRLAIMLAEGKGVSKNLEEAKVIIENLKSEGSQVANLNQWSSKISQAITQKKEADSRITTPVFSEEVKAYIRSYPSPTKPAIASAGRGEIVISCTVSATGSITNSKIKYRVLQRLDEAALNLVNNMPLLTPGTRGGENAPIKIDIGVSFFPTSVRIVQSYR